jgi:hypothetical protein
MLRLRQTLRRLAVELRAGVHAAVPEHRDSASALARVLGIDRASAPRVLALARRRDPDPESLYEAPGPEAMEQFVRALARKRPKGGADIAAVQSAIGQFRRVLQDLAGGWSS